MVDGSLQEEPFLSSEFLYNFEVVKKKSSNAKKTCRGLATFFQEKASLEMNYSKKLASLCKSGGGIKGVDVSLIEYKQYEEETMRNALDEIIDNHIQESELHRKYGEFLQNQVCKPIQNLRSGLIQRKDFLLGECDKLNKKINSNADQLRKENNKMRSIEMEHDKYMNEKLSLLKKLGIPPTEENLMGSANSSASSMQKLEKKIKDVRLKKDNALRILQDSQSSYKETQLTYYNGMVKILDEFQKTEKARLKTLKEIMQKLTEYEAEMRTVMSGLTDSIRVACDTFVVEEDLYQFINAFRGKIEDKGVGTEDPILADSKAQLSGVLLRRMSTAVGINPVVDDDNQGSPQDRSQSFAPGDLPHTEIKSTLSVDSGKEDNKKQHNGNPATSLDRSVSEGAINAGKGAVEERNAELERLKEEEAKQRKWEQKLDSHFNYYKKLKFSVLCLPEDFEQISEHEHILAFTENDQKLVAFSGAILGFDYSVTPDEEIDDIIMTFRLGIGVTVKISNLIQQIFKRNSLYAVSDNMLISILKQISTLEAEDYAETQHILADVIRSNLKFIILNIIWKMYHKLKTGIIDASQIDNEEILRLISILKCENQSLFNGLSVHAETLMPYLTESDAVQYPMNAILSKKLIGTILVRDVEDSEELLEENWKQIIEGFSLLPPHLNFEKASLPIYAINLIYCDHTAPDENYDSVIKAGEAIKSLYVEYETSIDQVIYLANQFEKDIQEPNDKIDFKDTRFAGKAVFGQMYSHSREKMNNYLELAAERSLLDATVYSLRISHSMMLLSQPFEKTVADCIESSGTNVFHNAFKSKDRPFVLNCKYEDLEDNKESLHTAITFIVDEFKTDVANPHQVFKKYVEHPSKFYAQGLLNNVRNELKAHVSGLNVGESYREMAYLVKLITDMELVFNEHNVDEKMSIHLQNQVTEWLFSRFQEVRDSVHRCIEREKEKWEPASENLLFTSSPVDVFYIIFQITDFLCQNLGKNSIQLWISSFQVLLHEIIEQYCTHIERSFDPLSSMVSKSLDSLDLDNREKILKKNKTFWGNRKSPKKSRKGDKDDQGDLAIFKDMLKEHHEVKLLCLRFGNLYFIVEQLEKLKDELLQNEHNTAIFADIIAMIEATSQHICRFTVNRLIQVDFQEAFFQKLYTPADPDDDEVDVSEIPLGYDMISLLPNISPIFGMLLKNIPKPFFKDLLKVLYGEFIEMWKKILLDPNRQPNTEDKKINSVLEEDLGAVKEFFCAKDSKGESRGLEEQHAWVGSEIIERIANYIGQNNEELIISFKKVDFAVKETRDIISRILYNRSGKEVSNFFATYAKAINNAS